MSSPFPIARPTLVQHRWARTLLFPALYFAQGVPWGFVSVGYVVMLTDLGLDETTIGSLLGLAYLPWSFKFVAGPLLDRIPRLRAGRRRPVVVLAELGMGASLLGLLFVDPARDVAATSAILLVHNACAALQDVAVDALAVDVLPDDERGRANSYMWAAKSAGVMIGGSFGTLVAGRLGWPAVFVMLVVIVWLVLGLVLWVLERPSSAVPEAPDQHLSLAALRRAFGFPTPWLAALVGLVAPVGYALVATPFSTLTRGQLGWTDEQIALAAFVDPWVGVAGALTGGWLADRFGTRRAMAGALLGVAGVLAGFAAGSPAWHVFAFTLGFAAVLGFLTNAYGAASLGYFMGLCDPAVGATQFSVYMATTNLTYAWTSAAGGWLTEHHGHAALFLVAGAAQVAAIGSLALADPAVARARYSAT